MVRAILLYLLAVMLLALATRTVFSDGTGATAQIRPSRRQPAL